MRHRLHPEAEGELTEAAIYYAEHASRGVASAFVVEFERVVALLERNQKLGALADEGLRYATVRISPLPYKFATHRAHSFACAASAPTSLR